MNYDDAMDMARAEYRRSILDGMGLFMIAEAWDIEPWAVTQYGGHGVLTEGFVLDQMAKQIMEMMRGKEEETADGTQGFQRGAMRVVWSQSRFSCRDMADSGRRQSGVCK